MDPIEYLKATIMDPRNPNRNDPEPVGSHADPYKQDVLATRSVAFTSGALGAFLANKMIFRWTSDRNATLLGGLALLFLGDEFNVSWQESLFQYYFRTFVHPEVIEERYLYNREQKIGR